MLARLPQSRLVFPSQLSSVYHKSLLQSTSPTPGIPVTHIRSSKSCRPSTPPSSPSSTYTSPTVQATMPKPPPLPPGYSKHHIVVLEGVHVAMPPFSIPHTIDVYPRTPSSQVLERIKSATIVITCIEPITPAHLDACPNLKCVCVMAVGMSWLDRHAFADRGITVTNTPGANVEAVREHVLALYFTLRKRVVECDQRVKAGGSGWRRIR